MTREEREAHQDQAFIESDALDDLAEEKVVLTGVKTVHLGLPAIRLDDGTVLFYCRPDLARVDNS